MMFMKFPLLIFSLLLISFNLFSQSFTDDKGQKAHISHAHDHHDPHKFHIGIGAAATYLTTEKEFAPGFHLHLIRQLGENKRWGLGLGYEAILDEHIHNGINLLVNYRPVRFLSLIAGPGMVLGKHDGEVEVLPGFHTEAVFEFDFHGLHVGPMIGFGMDREDRHVSVGLHIGIGR
jgi:hypothetical protein